MLSMKRVSKLILCGLIGFSVFVRAGEDDEGREDRRGCFARVCAGLTLALGVVASIEAGRKPEVPAPFIECRVGERSVRLRHSGDACNGEGVVFPLFNNGTDTVFEESGECSMRTGYPDFDWTYYESPIVLFANQARVHRRRMEKKGDYRAAKNCEGFSNVFNVAGGAQKNN